MIKKSKTKYGMSQKKWDKMQAWIDENRHNINVKNWLKKNPPPEIWKGTKLEYAYTEMPTWKI